MLPEHNSLMSTIILHIVFNDVTVYKDHAVQKLKLNIALLH